MGSFLNQNAQILLGCLLYINTFNVVNAFSTFSISSNTPAILSSSILQSRSNSIITTSTSLYAAGGSKKKKRRRKKPVSVDPAVPAPEVISEPKQAVENVAPPAPTSVPESPVEAPPAASTFKFDRDEAIALGVTDAEDEEDLIPEFAALKGDFSQGAVELPSFGETVRKKKQQKTDGSTDDMDEDDEDATEKIDRSDVSKFRQLLEVEPNADTDQSFFLQTEEYGTVSALLSEGAKPFLGIPSGPLQVGHFIGAGGIILMAFVEYPGFPLTNLPGPLRGALQGGLATIYLTNAVLAVLSIFKAQERDQPPALWAAKTFSVGGLAFDQLTQIPTKKEMEERLAKKGKRAFKRNNN